MQHVVFVGNPGTGKSTIANTIIGYPVFDSGVSLVWGRTDVLQSHTHNGTIYSDTPGLKDSRRRERAAQEISKAVNAATHLKLVFVVTLESGRVRNDDIATIDVVLKAVEEVGVTVDRRFSLIVNKCDPEEHRQLQEDNIMNAIKSWYGRGRGLSHVCVLKNFSELTGQTKKLLEDPTKVKSFVRQAPSVSMIRNDVKVDAQLYDTVTKRLRAEKEKILKDIKRMEADRESKPMWQLVAEATVGVGATALGAVAVLGLSAVGAILGASSAAAREDEDEED